MNTKVQQFNEEQKTEKQNIILSAHLNGDESMAFGAAFMAANMSTIYRVKPVHFYDGYDFDIQLSIKGLDESDDFSKELTLYPRRSRFNSKKSVGF